MGEKLGKLDEETVKWPEWPRRPGIIDTTAVGLIRIGDKTYSTKTGEPPVARVIDGVLYLRVGLMNSPGGA